MQTGSETSSTALTYTLLYLAHNPSVQRKLQAELDAVVGPHRQVNLDDQANLPYMNAFIAELQRLSLIHI